jgi:hypothetical protein
MNQNHASKNQDDFIEKVEKDFESKVKYAIPIGIVIVLAIIALDILLDVKVAKYALIASIIGSFTFLLCVIIYGGVKLFKKRKSY